MAQPEIRLVFAGNVAVGDVWGSGASIYVSGPDVPDPPTVDCRVVTSVERSLEETHDGHRLPQVAIAHQETFNGVVMPETEIVETFRVATVVTVIVGDLLKLAD